MFPIGNSGNLWANNSRIWIDIPCNLRGVVTAAHHLATLLVLPQDAHKQESIISSLSYACTDAALISKRALAKTGLQNGYVARVLLPSDRGLGSLRLLMWVKARQQGLLYQGL